MVSLELLVRINAYHFYGPLSFFDQEEAIFAQKQPENVKFGSFYAIFG